MREDLGRTYLKERHTYKCNCKLSLLTWHTRGPVWCCEIVSFLTCQLIVVLIIVICSSTSATSITLVIDGSSPCGWTISIVPSFWFRSEVVMWRWYWRFQAIVHWKTIYYKLYFYGYRIFYICIQVVGLGLTKFCCFGSQSIFLYQNVLDLKSQSHIHYSCKHAWKGHVETVFIVLPNFTWWRCCIPFQIHPNHISPHQDAHWYHRYCLLDISLLSREKKVIQR